MNREEAEERMRQAEAGAWARMNGNGPDQSDTREPLGPPQSFAAFAAREPQPHPFALGPLIPRAVPGMLAGDGDTYKTWFITQLQIAHALGLNFLGYDAVRMPTLGLYTETSADLLNARSRLIADGYGIDIGDLIDAHQWCRVGKNSTLFEPNPQHFASDPIRPTRLFHEICDAVAKLSVGGIMLDGTGTVYGGDRNSATQIDSVVRGHIAGLCHTSGAYSLLIFHPSRDAMRYGDLGGGWSTEWRNAHRFVLSVERPDKTDPDLLRLTRNKCNDAPPPRPEPIDYRYENGLLCAQDKTGMVVTLQHHNQEKLVLEAIRSCIDTGQKVARSPSGHANLAALLKKTPDLHPAAAKLGGKLILATVERLLKDPNRLQFHEPVKDRGTFLRLPGAT